MVEAAEVEGGVVGNGAAGVEGGARSGVGAGRELGDERQREAVVLEHTFEELQADEREDGEHEEREDAHFAQPLHGLHERENDCAQTCEMLQR